MQLHWNTLSDANSTKPCYHLSTLKSVEDESMTRHKVGNADNMFY